MPGPTPSQQIDVVSVLMDIKEVIGRLTQISADTRNDVMDIKSSQKQSDGKLASIEFKIDDLTKDHAELKASCVVHEARTKILEDKDIERKGAVKLLAVLWAGGTSALAFVILNFKTILEFLGLAHDVPK